MAEPPFCIVQEEIYVMAYNFTSYKPAYSEGLPAGQGD